MLDAIPTRAVGIRELKAHLSECLARVQAGERLTVTDRGRPIATITRIDAPAVPVWVQPLLGNRRARWAGGKPAGLARRVPLRGLPASEMVRQDRR
jgi:prevent-host-death family protein